MGGCSAVNCTNSTRKKVRMNHFPRDEKRRAEWVQNMRRDKFVPNDSSLLCDDHFEPSQFENKRADGKRKLKPNAIPTIFNVPNPPRRVENVRKSIYKNREILPLPSNPILNESNCAEIAMETPKSEVEMLREELQRKDEEIKELKEEKEKLLQSLSTFLNKEQIEMLLAGGKRSLFQPWTNNSIIKALKFRFALSIHGYEFLRDSKYPLPSVSTLFRRVKEFEINYGIFTDLLEPLKHKVAVMNEEDRVCVLVMDEIQIEEQVDFDKNKKRFFGHVTLGDSSEQGTHVLAVLIRGIKVPWKQVIAAHVTGKSTTAELIKGFLTEVISFLKEQGIRVLSITSDMGSTNRGTWTSLGVSVQRNLRQNFFAINDDITFVCPDVCHLLKNLKNAMLSQSLYLPDEFVQEENLPSNCIEGRYITELWHYDIDNNEGAGNNAWRGLHHLKEEDIDPDQFQKMHVGSAVRFFSIQTVSALETAVRLKILPEAALSTARFISLIQEWFALVSSRVRKCSITLNNKESKFSKLRRIVHLFQHLIIGAGGWKPLNTGMIWASLTIMDCCEYLLNNGYKFVLLHRFTQDCLENVFSQLRRRSSKYPSALDCLRALKIITLAQFISDVKRTNYMNDSDDYLLDHFKEKSDEKKKINSNQTSECDTVKNLPPPRKEFHVLDAEIFDTIHFDNLRTIKDAGLTVYSCNMIYHVAGSATKSLRTKVCKNCVNYLTCQSEAEISVLNKQLKRITIFTTQSNKGGLCTPRLNVVELFLNCEVIYKKYCEYLLHNDGTDLICKIVKEINVVIPTCSNCNLKLKLVNHFFTVRSFAVVSLNVAKKRKRTQYGRCLNPNKKLKM